jgi:hypothetical protein
VYLYVYSYYFKMGTWTCSIKKNYFPFFTRFSKRSFYLIFLKFTSVNIDLPYNLQCIDRYVTITVQLGTGNFGHHFSVTSKNCDVNHSLLSTWHSKVKFEFEIYFLFMSIACQSKSSQTINIYYFQRIRCLLQHLLLNYR